MQQRPFNYLDFGKFFFILMLLFTGLFSSAQTFKKIAVGDSKCQVYFFCDPGSFDFSLSEDSSKVYTGECKIDEISYGVICIQLSDKINDLTTAENVVVSYLDHLKGVFKISKSTGYGKGHRLNGNESTRGIIDYWEAESKENWKVKGWTNGKFIVVLFAYSVQELPVTKVNAFLDGLVFAE